MIKDKITRKKVTISDFKAHCTEYIRELENTDEIIEITRHGKVIAIVTTPPTPQENTLLGAGKGTAVITDSYDPHEPAFNPDDWEMNQ